MKEKDAWVFPIIGSCVLFGLYLLFLVFDKENLNKLFHFYFTAIGMYSIGCYLYERALNISFMRGFKDTVLFETPKIKWILEESSKIDVLFVITFTCGIIVGSFYFVSKSWMLNNLLGMCFSIFGIESMMLGKYKTGLILLGLLFFYDIFWVFGTPVMVGVAKNLEGPIKLMFPKDLFAETVSFNMIGLGDIVIPGFFVSLMLRYDIINNIFQRKENGGAVDNSPITWSLRNVKFFNFTMLGYALGIFFYTWNYGSFSSCTTCSTISSSRSIN